MNGYSPETLERRRKIAEALAYGATPKITHWAEGLNELAKGYVGGKMLRDTDQAESDQLKGETDFYKQQLGRSAASDVSQSLMGNDTPSAPQSFGGGDKDAFVQQFMPLAMQASQKTGVDPNIIVAQAALESGWGKSAPNNNYFGIKGEGQTLPTTEVVNGQPVQTQAFFKGFNSPEDSVNGYADFINKNPRYAPLKNAQGMDAQLSALQQSGYATDPQYGSKVGSIAKSLMDGQGENTSAPPQQVAQNDPKALISKMLSDPNPRIQSRGRELAKKQFESQLEGGDYGLSPIYGTDAQGNPAILQLGKSGARQVPLPNGFKLARDPVKVEGPTGTTLLDPQTRQQVGFIPKDNAKAESDKAQGKLTGESISNLPKIKQSAETIKGYIKAVKDDPYLQSMTGAFQGRLPNISGQSNTTQARIDQIKGGAFLAAFEALKGAGQITEVEGQKATQAKARLDNMKQDDAGYVESLNDFEKEVDNLVVLSEQRAGGGGSKPDNEGWQDIDSVRVRVKQ